MRIVIAAGTETSRALLGRGLEQEPRWKVVGEAGDPLAGFRVARALGADALLIDRAPGEAAPRADQLPVDEADFAVVSLVDRPASHADAVGVTVTRGTSLSRLRRVISEAVDGEHAIDGKAESSARPREDTGE